MPAATFPIHDTADLLRFSTAGSVDDGKSTLIGRLLYESKAVFQDQLEEVERASRARGGEPLNLALLTDGLRSEREQGITIDVAYRYFATPKRKFIVADTPGHAQYTRNMVTGTATADAAIVLIDAAHGITEQSRRHLYIAALVRVEHLIVCINKMDLVGFAEPAYVQLESAVAHYAAQLGVRDLSFIPISALHGDNVVQRSTRMPWYSGPALLPLLEEIEVTTNVAAIGARFPVQLVNRPAVGAVEQRRGYAGQVAAGVLRPGDQVIALPSGLQTQIRSIETFDGPLAEARPPLSVVLTLTDEIDISRGDMLCAVDDQPRAEQEIEAMLCWMSRTPLQQGDRYVIKHTTRGARAIVQTVRWRVDVNSLVVQGVASLNMNDIGQVSLRTSAPLCYDPYRRSRTTGSFILIHEATNETVAAGMILD